MSVKRKAAEPRNTAGRILDAAVALLLADGYQALSMRKVATKVGISQAAIYRHYTDKAELMGAIVEKGYSQLSVTLEKLLDPQAGTPAQLAAGIRGYVIFSLEHAVLFKVVLLQNIGPAQERINALAPGVARQRKTFALLSGLIAKGMADGCFTPADPEITAQAVWAAMFGLAARLVLEMGMSGTEPDSLWTERTQLIVERHIAIILGGLRGEEENI